MFSNSINLKERNDNDASKSPKAQFVDIEKASEPDLGKKKKISVVEMIRWGFEPPVINMLRALMGKVDSMQAQMDSVSKQMEVLRTKNKYQNKSSTTE